MVFIRFYGGYGAPWGCYIRTFSVLLDNLNDLLELLTALFEDRSYLLEDSGHILEDPLYIRTFQILLELPAWILEHSALFGLRYANGCTPPHY